MRGSAILREAWLNVVSGTSRALTITLVLATVTIAVQLADLATTRRYVEAAEAYQAAGASIETVAAPGRIDGDTCAALGRLPTVRAAGAVRTADSEFVAGALPGSPIPLFEVTGGFPEVLGAESMPSAGLILSETAATALGAGAGDAIASGTSDIVVRGTYAYPDDGRRTGFGFAALAVVGGGSVGSGGGRGGPTGEGLFDECWVAAWPQDAAIRSLLLTTVHPGTGAPDEEQPVLAPLNSTLGSTFTGAAENTARPTRWAVPFAGLLSFGACFASTRLRRLELASALHSGVRRSALIRILLLESPAWLAPVLALGFAVALLFARTGPSVDAVTTLLQGAQVPVVTTGLGLVGALVGTITTRESRLFRYFKSR